MLALAGISSPPVDPHAVARRLGVLVQMEVADDDISGALYRQDEGVVIGINVAHHPKRQRFTIAHELGHFVLHDAPVFVDRTYASNRPAKGAPAFLRNKVSGQAVDPVEIEANRFAASLLMPLDFLLSDLKEREVPVPALVVEELAERYGVSAQAMSYRLSNIGVPLDLGF